MSILTTNPSLLPCGLALFVQHVKLIIFFFHCEFTSDIRHLSGRENVIADSLSRPSVNALSSAGIDYDQFAMAQSEDDDFGAVRTAITGLQWVSRTLPSGLQVLRGVSTGRDRP